MQYSYTLYHTLRVVHRVLRAPLRRTFVYVSQSYTGENIFLKIPWGERWGSTPKPPPPLSPGLLRHCVHDITTSTRAADSCRGRQKSMCAVTKQAWPAETHVCRPVLAPFPGPSHTTRPPSVTSPRLSHQRGRNRAARRGGEDDGKIVRTRFFFF